MKIIFYSDQCLHCNKLITYITNNNLKKMFKFVNVDTDKYPSQIKTVPSIIDKYINQILTGEDVLNYIKNIKYFNIPTNNILTTTHIIPLIKEDEKALKNDQNYCNL